MSQTATALYSILLLLLRFLLLCWLRRKDFQSTAHGVHRTAPLSLHSICFLVSPLSFFPFSRPLLLRFVCFHAFMARKSARSEETKKKTGRQKRKQCPPQQYPTATPTYTYIQLQHDGSDIRSHDGGYECRQECTAPEGSSSSSSSTSRARFSAPDSNFCAASRTPIRCANTSLEAETGKLLDHG
jgi:hypothetical protein